MRRRTPLTRRTPLRAKQTTPAGLAEAREAVRHRSGGWCEVRTPACPPGAHVGVHAHHIRLRRHGDHTPGNLLWVCAPAHDWIHGHPAAARDRGWLA